MRQSRSRVQLNPSRGHSRRPLGQPTRGKTHANRLRRVDLFILRHAEALLRREDGDFVGAWSVDLGYGAEPTTTLEMARALRRMNPRARVLGVEIEPERVQAALPFADDATQFRLGGFNLPLQTLPDGRREAVRLIRAFNVLRQYDEASVWPAWQQMAAALLPDGLIIEGTSDPLGRLWVANLLQWQKDGDVGIDKGGKPECRLEHVALVFSTNFRQPFDPAAFQAVLPKNLIHRAGVGEPMGAFFEAWRQSAQATVAYREFGQRQWFAAAADALKQHPSVHGWRIDTRRRWLRSGFLQVGLPADLHAPAGN